ncbi:hypothetical protein EVAR_86846_1 [Eumeta japonica]|uniref:Uncharacterized protein n=1 Tax=Eumeta variegata TaxID=151549 RepID=A0A4C1VRW6_EUMVA|nr:hypothetical protein EVAR_86846_1 [Eumeta japonica]
MFTSSGRRLQLPDVSVWGLDHRTRNRFQAISRIESGIGTSTEIETRPDATVELEWTPRTGPRSGSKSTARWADV